jgi:hypothetical protein
MRNTFVTSFWKHAYDRLPAGTREQYVTQLQAAERWELALGDWIELFSRAKNAILRLFQAPSRAPLN